MEARLLAGLSSTWLQPPHRRGATCLTLPYVACRGDPSQHAERSGAAQPPSTAQGSRSPSGRLWTIPVPSKAEHPPLPEPPQLPLGLRRGPVASPVPPDSGPLLSARAAPRAASAGDLWAPWGHGVWGQRGAGVQGCAGTCGVQRWGCGHRWFSVGCTGAVGESGGFWLL